MKARRALTWAGVLLILVISIGLWLVFGEMKEMTALRYEAGEQVGAEVCAQCHEEIYQEWSENSRHAQATVSAGFLDFKTKFTDNLMFGVMMGEKMCYACHGDKTVNEGVNCETCHGPALPGVPIDETHERKYTPGLAAMQNSDFCGRCHEMANFISGDEIMSLFSELRRSEAGKQGVTCQGCHMTRDEDDRPYHGFDTAYRNPHIYMGDVEVMDIRLAFPRLSMTIENNIQGHAVPPSGPSRVMTLDISLLDSGGQALHEMTVKFAKTFTLMAGLMPFQMIDNSQLQSGEARELIFTLPEQLKQKVIAAQVTLRFHEISDEHQGDVSKAHWTSAPFLEKQVRF